MLTTDTNNFITLIIQMWSLLSFELIKHEDLMDNSMPIKELIQGFETICNICFNFIPYWNK